MRLTRSLSLLLTTGIIAGTFLSTQANAAPDPSAAKLVQWNLNTSVGFGISSEIIYGKPKLPSLEDAKKKLNSHPKDPQLQLTLADVLQSERYFDEAETHYAQAADLYKAMSAKRSLNVTEVINYAKSLNRLKKADEALAIAEKALSSEKKDTLPLHRFLGKTYEDQVVPCLCGVDKAASSSDFSAGLKSMGDPATLKKNQDKANEYAKKAKLHLEAALKDPKATAEDYYERGALDFALQMAKIMYHLNDSEESDAEDSKSHAEEYVSSLFDSPHILKALEMAKTPRAKAYLIMYRLLSKMASEAGLEFMSASSEGWPPELQKAVQDAKKGLNDMVTGTKTPPASAYDWLACITMMTSQNKEDIEAQKLACKALDIDPTLDNSFSIRVTNLVGKNMDLDEAIRRSRQKVNADHSELGYRMLIIAYAKSGKLAEAQSALQEAQKLAVDQNNAKDFDLIRGNLLILQNKPAEAVKPLQSVVEQDGSNASAPVSLAVAYYLQGMDVNAVQQLDIAKQHASAESEKAISELRALIAKN